MRVSSAMETGGGIWIKPACVCVCVFVAIDKHASMISDLNKSGTHFLNGRSLP